MDIAEEKKQLHIVDDCLISIAKKINLYKFLTPTNLLEERDTFIKHHGQYNPQFIYNFPKKEDMMTILNQLDTLKHQYFDTTAYSLPIAYLLKEKIEENNHKTHLLLAYIHQDFAAIHTYTTLLFGTFSQDILTKSQHILSTYKDPDPTIRGKKLTNEEIQIYIENYLQQEQIFDINIKIVPFSMNKFLMTFGSTSCALVFPKNLETREKELQANLIHEIQVHYKRYKNGKKSEWKILSTGVSHYFIDEEGLALYDMCAYKKQQYPDFEKKSIYETYILLHYSQGKSFVDIAEYIETLGIAHSLKTKFIMVANIKKGIQDTSRKELGNTFIKNKIYAEGLDKITTRIDQGNDKTLLYQGKIKIEDLPYIHS